MLYSWKYKVKAMPIVSMWQVQVLLFGIKKICLICSWMYPQVQNPRIQGADCIALLSDCAGKHLN